MAATTWVSPTENPSYWTQLEPAFEEYQEPPPEPTLNGATPHAEPQPQPKYEGPIQIESWLEFSSKAEDKIPCLVEGLWPEASLGFIASPPKKGKTWIGLSLALSVALGKPYLAEYDVNTAKPVLYIALEGHRSALTHRIAALAKGLGHDPKKAIDNLHMAYKPRGMNIADPAWAEHILNAAAGIEASLVIVDVLRAAARIKENDATEFSALRINLSPLMDDNRSISLLHHFTKLSEISRDRTPGERMSGSGAMYGAMDIGIFITGSEQGARKLRLEYDSRDLALPDKLGIYLEGEGTGPNGGFTRKDKAWWRPGIVPPGEEALKGAPVDIVEYLEDLGGDIPTSKICHELEISKDTLQRRRGYLAERGVTWRKIGRDVCYRANAGLGQDQIT